MAPLLQRLCLAVAVCAGVLALPARASPQDEDRLLILDLIVNGQRLDEAPEMGRSASGRWSIPLSLWTDLRLRSNPEAIGEGRLQGHAWLDGIPGIRLDFSPEQQALSILLPADAFETHRVGTSGAGSGASGTIGYGAYVNYDLNAQHRSGHTRWAGGIEWVGFGPGMRWVGRQYRRSEASGTGRWVRLDTSAEFDDVSGMRSLTIGDQVSSAGLWGVPMRMGGIGLGTRFSLQPGFLSFPLPSLSGEAALPSTIDLLVNQARVGSAQVPAGPFEWQRLPVLTGRGELVLQVTDLLGRKTELSQPYFVSTQLLKEGLADYSIQWGRVREDYGYRSASYGRHLLVAQYRRGLSGRLTGELRLERLSGQTTFGLGGVWNVGDRFLMQASVAGSQRLKESGHAWSLGVDLPGQLASLQFRSTRASQHFVQLGADSSVSSFRTSHRASILLPWSRGGAALTWVRRQPWQAGPQRFWMFSVSASVGSRAFLSAFVQSAQFESKRRMVGVTLVMPLERNSQTWMQATSLEGQSHSGIGWTSPRPAGPGWGHRMYLDGDGQIAASVEKRGMAADWRAELNASDGQLLVGSGLSGSVVLLGGQMRMARRIEDSFALLKVGDMADIPVYRDQHLVGLTDKDGLIVLNALRSNQPNLVHVDPNDLPMDTVFDRLQLRLLPPLGSGLFADMPVRRVRPVTFRLHGPDGRQLNAGTEVRALDDGSIRTVGFDGKLFEPDWNSDRVYEIVLADHRCRFRIAEPPPDRLAQPTVPVFCVQELP